MSNPCALPTLAYPPTEADLKTLPALTRKLARRLGVTNATYNLIADGDRILVAVSGGKDSWALLDLLERLRKRAPVTFSVDAVTVDPGFPQFNPDPIAEVCERLGVPHHVIPAPIDKMVRTKPEELPCIICSRLRLDILSVIGSSSTFSAGHGQNRAGCAGR